MLCLISPQAGDALFIPEGWWHQVDSAQTTIAVNFWWQSAFTKGLQQQPHMQQYYLRRLMDGLLDTERSNALASVQPHPAVQALQAAEDTVASWHSSDQTSDMTTSGSSDSSSANTATSSPAAVASAVAIAAEPAEQVAHSISPLTAAASSQPQDSGQLQGSGHGQSESSQNAPPATTQARQSGADLSDSLERCKPGRKRKAADNSNGCRSDDAAEAHEAPLQVPQASDGHTLPPGPAAEHLPAARRSAQQADSGQSQDVIAPTFDGSSAAGSSVQQHAEASRAEADCAGQQEPLHIACMQILAGAVADCLDRPGGQSPSMGKPALLRAYQQSCGTVRLQSFCCIASAVSLLKGGIAKLFLSSTACLFCLSHIGLEDPITCILASLQPEDLRSVLAMMSRCVPRTLEALLLHALLPAAAELLTQKMEQADASAAETGLPSAYGCLQSIANCMYVMPITDVVTNSLIKTSAYFVVQSRCSVAFLLVRRSDCILCLDLARHL